MAEKSGFKTKRAQTGEAILNLVHTEQPVLIVLEPDLPGKVRGWEVVLALRNNDENSQIAMILFSWLKKDDVEALVENEIIYLPKPDLNFEDFSNALVLAGIQTPPAGNHKLD
jgi:DNA-binding response OmpR family regulator